MGFFDRRNKSIQSTGGWDVLAKAIQRVWTKPPMRDSGELPELFHKNPRLSPVAAISRAVASTPYQLFDKIDYRKNKNSATPILDHEILDLLDAPIRRYPEIDGYFMFYTIEALTKLVGEAFLLKVRDEKGHVIELDIIPPAWVTQVPSMSSPWFIVYPYGTAAARSLTVSPDDMITFRRPNLSDPYGRGRGVSEPLEQEFVADENMARMQSNFAYNDATPPYILSVPGLPPDQADAFKKSWMEKIGGIGHRREPGILGFPADVKTLAMSPVELDMIESRKFIRDMSSEHYQIPPEILGRIENSNRSTIDSAFYLYNKNVLCYEYGFIERTITRQLIVPDFDKRLVFKFDPSIPEDEEHKLSVLNAGLQAGAVMLDEWRKAFDLPEVPNGKGKVFLRTFAQYEVPADDNGPELPPEKPSGQTEDKPTDDALLSPEDLGLDAESAKSFKIVDYSTEKVSIVSKSDPKEARLTAIWKAFDSRATAKEGEFIQAVKKYAEDQKKRVVSAINNSKLEDTIKSGGAYNAEVESILRTVFDDKANKALKSALAPAWLHSLESGRDHTYDMIYGNFGKAVKAPKIRPSMTVVNTLFQQYVESVGLLKAEGINDTTNEKLRKKLQDAISEGISNGDNLNAIKNSILDVCDGVYDEMSTSRAMLIGRTESSSSVTSGTYLTGKAEGMTRKTWLSQIDERTRIDHVDVDGQTVGIDEPFIVGNCEMQYPLDQACGDAGQICNCRCTIIFDTE